MWNVQKSDILGFDLLLLRLVFDALWSYVKFKRVVTVDWTSFPCLGWMLCIYKCCMCIRAYCFDGDGWYKFWLYKPESQALKITIHLVCSSCQYSRLKIPSLKLLSLNKSWNFLFKYFRYFKRCKTKIITMAY